MKKFLKASIIRAIRTMAQAMLAYIGSAVVVNDVDWRFCIGAAAMAGILSMLTSIVTGLPEVEDD